MSRPNKRATSGSSRGELLLGAQPVRELVPLAALEVDEISAFADLGVARLVPLRRRDGLGLFGTGAPAHGLGRFLGHRGPPGADGQGLACHPPMAFRTCSTLAGRDLFGPGR